MKDFNAGLNDQQRIAVAHRKGPAIVLAGPGAGKTKVLTTRAAALVNEEVSPESILLLTFTRASAQGMMRRAMGFDPRCEFLSQGTFHSIASRIINQNVHVFGSDRPFTVLDSDDATEVIRRVMEPLKAGAKNWPRASTVSKVISYAANCEISIKDAIERKAPDYLELSDEISAVQEAYITYKFDHGMLDYDDCLTYFAVLLEDEEIGPALRRRWSYVMIDEYQDTNPLQLRIVYAIAKEHMNILVVGDPSQSIYGFRGSAPATLADFHKRFPEARIIPLETNYRSSPEIVSMVNAVDKAIDSPFDRTLLSTRPSAGIKPQLIDVTDAASEAAAIADAILADKADGGEIRNHAILVRSTVMGRRIETEFISRHIPYRIMGGVKIDEAAHIKDLLSLARVSINPAFEPAWLRLLQRFPRIGEKASSAITERLISSENVQARIEILKDESIARKSSLEPLANAFGALIAADRFVDGLHHASQAMENVWAGIWTDDWESRRRDIDAVLLIAEEHSDMSSFLTAITLDASMDKENRTAIDKPEELPVTISTIHSAKGLEWENVHIPQFVQGGMPSMFASGPEDMSEEYRIFYVAVSRAEKRLSLYRPRFTTNGNFTSASQFEPLIRACCETASHRTPVTAPTSAPVETEKRIDMRARLLQGRA